MKCAVNLSACLSQCSELRSDCEQYERQSNSYMLHLIVSAHPPAVGRALCHLAPILPLLSHVAPRTSTIPAPTVREAYSCHFGRHSWPVIWCERHDFLGNSRRPSYWRCVGRRSRLDLLPPGLLSLAATRRGRLGIHLSVIEQEEERSSVRQVASVLGTLRRRRSRHYSLP